ncbi:hypothetical protein [Microbacterium maritypicum]|uniref:hypothetical protein n=1 Tax=Microbacterium maritypicum TaxID=33918 RepID=UPI00381C121C
MPSVSLLGGRFHGVNPDLRREPLRIVIAGETYARIDDPDTGESLGAYVVDRRQDTGSRS